MEFKQALIRQIKDELTFQQAENEKGDENYLAASEYHTHFVLKLNDWADKYPNFIDVLLDQHIQQEEEVFGDDTTQFNLTQHEKGRIYSLVRCRHMKRIANEGLNQ